MGGQARLRGVEAIDYTALGTRMMVEQSERPSGPYFFDHFRVHEIRDLTSARTRIEQADEGYAADRWWLQQETADTSTTVINGDVAANLDAGRYSYGGGYLVQANEEQFAFAPERLLLTAMAAPDLHALPDAYLHGIAHHVLAFTWQKAPCRLFINADTNLPWKIQWTRPYPYQTFLNAWGDVTTSITYNAWTLEPYGITYPREWTYERVGLPDEQIAIVQLHINPAISDGALTIPPAIFAEHHGKLRKISAIPLGHHGSGPPVELAPGILQYPGGWNVEFVKQDDGIVIIEAPWSPAYAQRAFDAARQRYGLKIKAVITTSDSWPHIAGVRQAVARDIPIYALDLNQAILTRLVRAPHTMDPDQLAMHPRSPKFRFVSKPRMLGAGANRLLIVPYRTATGERQMMVYFPEHQLLYTSDLFAPDGNGGWFTPEYLQEMLSAVAREKLKVRTIFGMHYPPTPYQSAVDYVRRFTHTASGPVLNDK